MLSPLIAWRTYTEYLTSLPDVATVGCTYAESCRHGQTYAESLTSGCWGSRVEVEAVGQRHTWYYGLHSGMRSAVGGGRRQPAPTPRFSLSPSLCGPHSPGTWDSGVGPPTPPLPAESRR